MVMCVRACGRVRVNKFNLRITFTTPKEYGLVEFAFRATQYVFNGLEKFLKILI